jgi:hypothetical protein
MNNALRMGMAVFFGLLSCVVIAQFRMPAARAEESEPQDMLGASTTLTGLSGLLITETPHTLAPSKVAVSLTGIILHSSNPSTFYEGAGQFAIGLPLNIELAAMVPGVHYDSNGTITGLGDVELSAKWRLLDQLGAQWPSVAVGVTGTLPTGEQGSPTLPYGQSGMGLRTVQDYGIAIKLMSSAEVDFSPDLYAIGLYVEGSYTFQDMSKDTQDKYGTYAVGAALPLLVNPDNPMASPFQFLMEVDGTYKRGNDQDYVGVTPGLRYVGRLVTVTGAFRYQGYHNLPNAYGGIAQVGITF